MTKSEARSDIKSKRAVLVANHTVALKTLKDAYKAQVAEMEKVQQTEIDAFNESAKTISDGATSGTVVPKVDVQIARANKALLSSLLFNLPEAGLSINSTPLEAIAATAKFPISHKGKAKKAHRLVETLCGLLDIPVPAMASVPETVTATAAVQADAA